ncbi:hypothetical protein V1478_008519 [Vespula squamosa]|uniref:Uncharacterized protein n=1 Tax=Vespula squamosa TaxID=30214 RepID=A0ABD2ATR0_VESSQ
MYKYKIRHTKTIDVAIYDQDKLMNKTYNVSECQRIIICLGNDNENKCLICDKMKYFNIV